MLEEGLAADVGALDALAVEVALDHHLSGDPGMVHADDPQGVLAEHPLAPGQHVLERVVERVPDVQVPVTLGGGMTIVHGVASGRSGRNRPSASQWAYQRSSIARGSKVLGSSLMSRGG